MGGGVSIAVQASVVRVNARPKDAIGLGTVGKCITKEAYIYKVQVVIYRTDVRACNI
jgi:hypothetical protein